MSATSKPVNWIADSQNAPQPPDYFLQAIYDYDAMLVLMPSRERVGTYVLGRRKQWGPGLSEKALDGIYTKADTKMCILHGAVPVCMVFQQGVSWDPWQIIEKLRARDLWAHGGADKVADMLEAQEAKEQERLKAEIRDDLYNRSGDAWRSYQARTGQSTIKFHDNLPVKGQTADSPPPGEVAAPSQPQALEVQQDLGATGADETATSRLSAGAEP